MATLGKLLRAHYEGQLADQLFFRDERFPHSTTYTRENQFKITYDRMKGGDLRLFLSVGMSKPEIEAESPYWSVREKTLPDDAPPELDPSQYTLEFALDSAWQFLEVCGFKWFSDPLALTPTEWRVNHNLLVRDYRQTKLTLSWPSQMKLNDRIIRAKRCIPAFKSMAALQLRNQFADIKALQLGAMPLANALELKKEVESEGLSLDVRIV